MRRPVLALVFALAAAALSPAGCGGGHSPRAGPAEGGQPLRLLSPDEGDTLVHRSPVSVRWNARDFGPGTVTLESSVDGGVTWRREASAAPGEHRIAWAPDVTGEGILLRLIPSDGGAGSRPRRITVRPFPEEIVPGLDFWVATMSDGSVWFWGEFPQTFWRESQSLAGPMPELAGLRPLAAAIHVLAVDPEGRLHIWGDHDGFRDPWPAMPEPVPLEGPEDVAWAACEYNLSFAAGRDGRVWGWGNNVYGSVGDGTTFDRLAPVRVPDLDGVAKIAVGRLSASALRVDGTVLTWGWNLGGELGDGPGWFRPLPRAVPGIEGAVDIAAGMNHVLALEGDGTVLSWGGDGRGLGGGGTPEPTAVEDLPPVVQVQAGSDSSYALDAEGRLWAWGNNGRGQLGDGTMEDRTDPVLAVAVPPLERFFVGPATVHAITQDGRWIAWGSGFFGHLGTGSWDDTAVPVELLRR